MDLVYVKRVEVFSHTDNEGTIRHFNVSELWEGILNNGIPHEVVRIELDANTISGLEKDHHVTLDEDLSRGQNINTPVLIVGFEDDTNLVIDGNHRLVRRFRLGLTHAKAVFVHPSDWVKHLIPHEAVLSGRYVPVTEKEAL